mgnify:CR=1 FL=1
MTKRQRILSKGNPQKMKAIRTRIGVNQTVFGEMLGVSKNTVARWERGDLVPPKIAELAAERLASLCFMELLIY